MARPIVSITAIAQLTADDAPDALTLTLTGRLDAQGVAGLWKPGTAAVERACDKPVRLNLAGVGYLDLAGATFIARLTARNRSAHQDRPTKILGLKPEFEPLLALAETKPPEQAAPPAPLSPVEKTGRNLARFLDDVNTFVTFVGEITWAIAGSIRRPGSVRWTDAFLVAERAGVDALPIVLLISFIVGLVMAFQAAIPMKTFGAEIYVANLIGIAMVRELGPLMTAIVLAGRSASAFAAEIGTMKINEEIDALTVMGMDPVRFLILPRIIATTLITPLLTVFANLIGILGGAVVILSFGYPFITYYNQVAGFVTFQDLTGGLVKCFFFGLIIAATGCIRGYQTLRGPSAVGESTTRAVVSSIILIAVFDGIFSVVYYCLGI